ncbi:SSI family serine proteinase inhibitor [Nonomuraea terrae]|uniref:SSI family serine proteinase inhibitor n=1 Tax=Nonomuraea terrae TaxID=2530383 RepID=UPI0037A5821C
MLRAAGAIALCGAVLLGSSPALAAPPPKVQVKVIYAVKGGETKSVWLHCGPTGGDHPRAQAACRLLEKAKGQPGELNLKSAAACKKELKPHAAAVVGRWNGQVLKWGKVYANGCQMRAATGALFAL